MLYYFFCRNLGLSPRKRSITLPRIVLNKYHSLDYNDNTLNEDLLFPEVHRDSTVSILGNTFHMSMDDVPNSLYLFIWTFSKSVTNKYLVYMVTCNLILNSQKNL